MALTSAGLESRAARATFKEVVVEVAYFALDMAADFMTSRSEGDGCDQTNFSPILFPMYRGGRCRQGVLLFVAALSILIGALLAYCDWVISVKAVVI